MREDGRFHSAHRDSIETLLRHLHQEVGRYENHKFYVLPRRAEAVPHIEFVYTGEERDRSIEAYVEGYTDIRPVFVDSDAFQAQREAYVGLKAYEKGQSALWGYFYTARGSRASSQPQSSRRAVLCSLTSRCSPKWGVILGGTSFKNDRKSPISLANPPDFRPHFWMRC